MKQPMTRLMNRRVFAIGFVLSLLLVGICGWYTFASPARAGVLDSFDRASRGWYVHQPTGFNVSILTFAVLNLPVVLIAWGVIAAADTIVVLPATGRAALTYATLIAFSAIWWRMLASWRGKQRERR